MNETLKVKRDVLKETIAMYLLMFAYAIFTTIIGAILLNLLSDFPMPLTEGGFFNAVLNGGCFVGILLSGMVIDRYGKRIQIVAAFSLFTIFLFAVYFTSSLQAYVVSIFFAGLAVKIMDALLNATIVELHTRNRGFYMNLLHCCFGIGSFVGPILAGFVVESNHSWRLAYLILAIVCCILLGIYLANIRGRVHLKKSVSSRRRVAAGFRHVLSWKIFLLWLVLFFYCGHQVGINNWLPTYMSETLGLDMLAAGSSVSMFWIGLILGRFTCSFLTKRMPERTLTLLGAGLGGLALLAGIVTGGEIILFFSALAAGFFSGATVPMVLTIAYGWYPGAQGKVSMILYLAITIGAVVFPWLMGLVQHVVGLKIAMMSNAFMLLIPCCLVFLVPKPVSREQSE